MSPSNLGIVFGPSLIRPRPTGATISLSSLVDYPHQARIVEALIVFYSSIFQCKIAHSNKPSDPESSSAQQVRMEETKGQKRKILFSKVLLGITDNLISW